MASVDGLKKLRLVAELGKSANSTSGCTEAGHDSTSAARASIEDCLAKKDARASANLELGAQSGPWRRALVPRVACSFEGHYCFNTNKIKKQSRWFMVALSF